MAIQQIISIGVFLFLFGLVFWHLGILKFFSNFLFHYKNQKEVEEIKRFFDSKPEILDLNGQDKITEFLKYPLFQKAKPENIIQAEQELNKEKPFKDLRVYLSENGVDSTTGIIKKFKFFEKINNQNPIISGLLIEGFKPEQLKKAIKLNERGKLTNGKQRKIPRVPTRTDAPERVPIDASRGFGAISTGEREFQRAEPERASGNASPNRIESNRGVAEQRDFPVESVEGFGDSKQFDNRKERVVERKEQDFERTELENGRTEQNFERVSKYFD